MAPREDTTLSTLEGLRSRLLEGLVIPAHPLALTSARGLDERRQRALTRYYHAAGAGGLAVGVHTTQFAIREPRHGLLEPVLALAAGAARERDGATGRATVLVAGICGPTAQALAEARLARALGYHAGLLSLGALRDAADDALIEHARAVAGEIPLFGFYLQPAAGGRILSHAFWRRFVELPAVVAIKVAPFDRYRTLDVVRAVAASGRASEIALYTGNDDSILIDLVAEHVVRARAGEAGREGQRAREVRLCMAGGLLGQWAVGTRRAVELLEAAKRQRGAATVPRWLLDLHARLTDANAAIFDAANAFAGCIPGIHEVLRRQGLLEGAWCLDPAEVLSPGQAQEIERVLEAYPELFDDAFVRENLQRWLED